jgi:hypothetical protein
MNHNKQNSNDAKYTKHLGQYGHSEEYLGTKVLIQTEQQTFIDKRAIY